MRSLSHRGVFIAGFIGLLASTSDVSAGDLHNLFGQRSSCGCGQSRPHAAAFMHAPRAAGCGCACSAAASSCCGIGGGLTQMGNLYGLSGYGLNSGSLPLPSGPRAGAYEQSVAWELGGHQDPWSGAGYGASGNDLTGYEGLPNMDGGGVNHRYPYHSYRRPWAHPGPPSTNVSIVW